MGWTYVALLAPLLAAPPAAVAALAGRRRNAPAAILSGLLAALALWGLAYALELAAGDLDGKIFWASAGLLAAVAAPPLWVAFVLLYTGRDGSLNRGAGVSLAVLPAVSAALIWTNSYHGLVWSDARLNFEGPVQTLAVDHGPWFWVIVAYSYGMLFLGAGPVVSSLLGHHRPYRAQSALLLLAVLAPWTASGSSLLRAGPAPGVSLTPFAFPLTAALLALAILRYRLLDISPIARDTTTEGLGSAVIILDSRYRIVDLNPAAERFLGRKAAEIVGSALSETSRGRVRLLAGAPEASLLRRYEEDGEAQVEVTLGEGDERRTYNLVLSPLRGERGRRGEHLMVLHDVTGRKASEERLERLAHHDTLTGLPNRRLFHDRLERALAMARRRRSGLAVLFLDLDGFKCVNDSLGHAVGDLLLKEVAGRLVSCLRESDTVARQSGDEFAVLLPEVSESRDAVLVANRILDAFAAPFKPGDHELRVSASIGICLYPDGGQSPDALLQRADTAMYRAKGRGKNGFEFYAAPSGPAPANAGPDDDLPGALRVYYQPLVRLDSGRVCEVEALARWEHREYGLLLPADFLPAAETSGLILEVGRSVLGEACAQVTRWRDVRPGSLPSKVCVNLSTRQLLDPSVHRDIARTLHETGLDAGNLTLDLSEESLLEAPQAAGTALERLKELGVRLAIDDFGTGHSSLRALRSFPIDLVKIDRSLVAGVKNDPESQTMVAAIVALARALNLEVVGKGVESPRQLAHLGMLGCDMVQGHYLAKALPPGKVAEAIRLIDRYFRGSRAPVSGS